MPLVLSMEGALRSDDLQPQPQIAVKIAERALEVKRSGAAPRLEALGFSWCELGLSLKTYITTSDRN